MDKKYKISWGVSFGSLALVAGMVSYLGLSSGDKADNQLAVNQGQPSTTNTNQQSQDNFNSQQQQGPTQGFEHSFGRGHSSRFNQNDQDATNSFDDSDQNNDDQFFDNSNQQDQFSNGGSAEMGRHGGFDTTTGGT